MEEEEIENDIYSDDLDQEIKIGDIVLWSYPHNVLLAVIVEFRSSGWIKLITTYEGDEFYERYRRSEADTLVKVNDLLLMNLSGERKDVANALMHVRHTLQIGEYKEWFKKQTAI